MEDLYEQVRTENPGVDDQPEEGTDTPAAVPAGGAPPTSSDPLEAFLHWQSLYIKYIQV